MKIADLNKMVDVTGVNIWDGGTVKSYISKHEIQVSDLLVMIASANGHCNDVRKAIKDMIKVLDDAGVISSSPIVSTGNFPNVPKGE